MFCLKKRKRKPYLIDYRLNRFTNRLKVVRRKKGPRAGSRLARAGDLEPLHILVPLLVLI